MPAKKKAPTTPLQLLQQLSSSLVVHFDKACRQALDDAEQTLAKLEKQRGKAQDKLLKARGRLDEAGTAGKAKAQAKVRARIDELEASMALLQGRQGEMLTYIAELKRDVATAMELTRGIREVEQGAAAAASQLAAGQASPRVAAAKPRAPRTSKAAAASTAKPAASARGAAKPAAGRSSSAGASTAKPATARQAAAKAAPAPSAAPKAAEKASTKPASAAAKPRATASRKPVAAKPAAAAAAKPANPRKPSRARAAAKPVAPAASEGAAQSEPGAS